MPGLVGLAERLARHRHRHRAVVIGIIGADLLQRVLLVVRVIETAGLRYPPDPLLDRDVLELSLLFQRTLQQAVLHARGRSFQGQVSSNWRSTMRTV